MITDTVSAAVESMMVRLLADTRLYKDIIWKKFVSAEFNAGLGYNVDTYADYSLKGVKASNIRNTWLGGYPVGFESGTESGDVSFFFRASDVPSGISIRDVLQEGSVKYRIKSFTPVLNLLQVDVEGIGVST